MTNLVFVHNDHLPLTGAPFIGRGLAKGVAYALEGGRAGFSPRGGGDAFVGGELYEATPELLAALDNDHGAGFERRVIGVRAGSEGPLVDAWVHVWTGAWEHVPHLAGGRLPGSEPTAWYFGYASNMYHFAERRKIQVFDTRLGRIDGWRIAFAKDSGNGQHCYATLLPKRGGEVRGALYRMTQSELEGQLDPQEKEGWHLVRRTFEVDLDGTRVFAEVYCCLPRWWVWGRISHPTNTEKIVGGAKLMGLDPEYVAWLERFVDEPCRPEDYDLDLHALVDR